MFKIAEAFVDIGASLKPFDAAMKTVQSKLSSLASMRFSVPGGGILATLGLVGAGAAVTKSLSGASDLAETVSKVGQVYGDQAKVVTDAADQMAKAFGIPKREFMDAASQFGLIATGMGKSEEAAAGMSVKLAKLAADASSFYNVPVAVALEKIRAGLTGESEPLKAFGIIMDEAAVKAYAYSHGLAKVGQELTNQAKLEARSAIITNGLATASGDLARTQDGAANQVRKFWGTLTNLGDVLGTHLMPAFTAMIELLNTFATDMEKAASTGGSAFQGFVATFKSVMETVGVIYRNWASIVERTGIMIGGWLKNMVERFLWLKDTIAAFLSWFATNWRTIFTDTFNAVTIALGNLGKNFMDFGQAAYDWIASGFTKPFEMKFTPVMEGFEAKTTAFKAPDLKLSSVKSQLDDIDQKMVQSEQKVADAKLASAKKGEVAKAAKETYGATEKKKELKSEFVGLADFAKKIQSGSLDKDKATQETAKNTAKMAKSLDEIARHPQKVGPGVAVGPA